MLVRAAVKSGRHGVSRRLPAASGRGGTATRSPDESVQGLYGHRGSLIQFCDPVAAAMFGYESPDELLGRDHRVVVSARDWSRLDGELQARLTPGGPPWRSTWDAVRRDGSTFPVEAILVPVTSKGEAAVMIALVDLGARERQRATLRQAEEHLRQAQKIEALGRLAGGVAHDFNNLLTVVSGRTELLQTLIDHGHPARREVEVVQATVDRAMTLTRRLLAFSRPQAQLPSTVELNAVVVDMAVMLRRLIGDHIDLVVHLAPGLGRVQADAGEIEQVLLNLVLNARDAMPRGGRLTLTTGESAPAAAPAAPGDVSAGPCVVLSVADTGTGMDERVRTHLFEPFFTTKDEGKGTGLGLFTVYGIVAQRGGTIGVDSAPGRGTVFRIFLPRVAEPGIVPSFAEQPAAGVP
jgi:PAS domain S-box-containing protein